MLKQLRPEDAHAVDLLLNTTHGHDGKALVAGFVHHGTVAGEGRLASAERVFQLLSELPEIEPSADLMQRTMSRIEAAVYGGRPGLDQPAIPRQSLGDQPVA